MEELGKELRQKRIQLGYTIEDIAQMTRISSKHIRQLENGDIGSFSDDLSYLPFYLKNYCEVLDVDFNEVKAVVENSIISYTQTINQQEIERRKKIEHNINNNVKPKKNNSRLNIELIVVLIVGAALLTALAYGVITLIQQSGNKPSSSPTTIQKETPPAPTKKEETPAPQPENNEAKITATNDNQYSIALKKEATFSVELTKDSWISFSGSTNPLTEKVYTSNEKPTIKVKVGDTIQVRLGVVAGNKLKIDNQEINYTSTLNQNIPQTFVLKFVGA